MVAVLVAAGAAVAVVLLTSGSGDSNGPFQQKLTQAFAPVAAANAHLSDALGALHGIDVSSARRAAAAAESATSSAQGALNALTVPSASGTLASQTRQALDREESYLSAVSVALDNPSNPGVSQLQTLSGNLTSALDAAGGPLTGAAQGVAGADTLTAWAQRRAHAQQAGSSSAGSSSSASSGGSSSASPGPYANGRDCGGGLYAGPNTSCDFALNTQAAYNNAPGATATVTVYSPVTGQTYMMNCTPAGNGVTCSGGNGASVSW